MTPIVFVYDLLDTVRMRASLLLTALVFAAVFIWSMCRKKKNGRKALIRALLAAYFYFILAITLFGRTAAAFSRAEWVPLWSWNRALHGDRSLFAEIALNVLLFLPFGLLLRLNWPIKIGWVLLIGLAMSLAIEFVQYAACCGLFEWDDVLHNTAGCLLGAGLGNAVCDVKKKRMQSG